MEKGNKKMNFKIGMVAPSKAGKTSVMTSIFYDMRNRLAENRLAENTLDIQYWADGKATQNAITRAIAEFKTCTSSDDIFDVPRLQGNVSVNNYKFAFTVPVEAGVQRLNIDIMDYPGGLLGTPEFAERIQPHLRESSALIVPIPSDLLMEWKRTTNVNNNHSKKVNILAQMLLEVNEVCDVIANWIKSKNDENAILIFVPIRCEIYFDDNGGTRDESEILHEAVNELYINPIKSAVSTEQLKKIRIEVHAVDTYGIVELRDVALETSEDGTEYLVSTFKKRLNMGNEIKSKGALEVLASIIRFYLGEKAKVLDMKRDELEKAIESRSLLRIIVDMFCGNKKKVALAEQIRKYDGAFQAMIVVSKLLKPCSARQRVVNETE